VNIIFFIIIFFVFWFQVVQLLVKLRNQLVSSKIDFKLGVSASPTFEIIGMESTLMSLEGGEERTIPLQALIPRPGVHNLQRLEVKLEQELGSYSFPESQWLVSVAQA
jgi:hypothetical protein